MWSMASSRISCKIFAESSGWGGWLHFGFIRYIKCFVEFHFCVSLLFNRMALNLDDDELDAEDQLKALKAVNVSKGNGGALQAVLSQMGFKRIVEQRETAAKTRSRYQSKRSKFPKMLSQVSVMLDKMQMEKGVPVDSDLALKLVMSAAHEDYFEGSISQGWGSQRVSQDMIKKLIKRSFDCCFGIYDVLHVPYLGSV